MGEAEKALRALVDEWNVQQDLVNLKIGKYDLQIHDYIMSEYGGELNSYLDIKLVLIPSPDTRRLVFHRSYRNIEDRELMFREALRDIFMGGLYHLFITNKELREKNSGVR